MKNTCFYFPNNAVHMSHCYFRNLPSESAVEKNLSGKREQCETTTETSGALYLALTQPFAKTLFFFYLATLV